MIKYFTIPTICPCCGHSTLIKGDFLVCENPNCEGKFLNKLDHFCSKKGLNIKGLSKATLEKLIDWNWIENIKDIFTLKDYRNEWIEKPGFGIASVDKILNAIEEARICDDVSFISALGIPLIGNSVAKILIEKCSTYLNFRNMINEKFDFSKLDGFAESKTSAIWNFDYSEADEIYEKYICSPIQNTINNEEIEKTCDGLKFVITGKLNNYKKRDDLKLIIENMGGKVMDSVSKNTNYLINNDITSTTGKNQSAQKLGIPIITEEEFEKNFLK